MPKLSEVRDSVEVCLKALQPVCLWGLPGVGKSQLMAQIAKAWGIQLKDFRAVLHDSTDLTGVPYVQEGATKWAIPSFLPQAGEGILFLDELNRAPSLVQNACFQLVQDRSIGEYHLPDGWMLAAACNPGGIGTTKFSDALKNRFLHLDVDVNLEDWVAWANNNNIDPIIVAFIRFRTELLHKYSATDNAFPTPRSWEFVAKILASDPPDKIKFHLFEGAVGKGAATEFAAFLLLYKDLPSIEQIIHNPSKAEIPERAETLYAVASALARRAEVSNLKRIITYIDRLPNEYAVLTIKDAMQRDKALTKTSDFIQWAADHNDVFSS